MARRIRWIALALVVVVVTGTVILVITVRPGLQDDAQDVQRAWRPLVQPLAVRYGTLPGLVTALDAVGNGNRDLTKQLKHSLSDWDLLRASTDDGAQARTADDLESLAARIRASVEGSPRLKPNPALNQAIAAFDATKVPPSMLKRYNDAVLQYERNRDGMLRNIVASIDGYDAHPTLQLTGP
jgi:hypothetical protein